MSADTILITDEFQEVEGYSGFTLTSGALYNANSLERADYYNYILMKNKDNLYISAKDIKIKTTFNDYTIPMNSIINFTSSFVTWYSLEDDEFVYGKAIDVDENTKITIEDYGKEYTYKQFLIGLKIVKDNTKKPEAEIEKNEEVKKENTEKNEEVNTEEPSNTVEEPEVIPEPEKPNKDNQGETTTPEVKWIKPTVEGSNFTANVYTATAEISINDPSRVMNGVTYSFYKDDKLAFRTSANSTGTVSVTKLLPSTTYKIVAKYQYRNKEGSLIENNLFEQEITTQSVSSLNAIELGFENGPIYSSKIVINNLRITSDLQDEAIYGITKGEILINGASYTISTALLRNLASGNSIQYHSPEGLKSNTKYNYEIILYDVAGNKMALKNNTGATETSKKAPSVKITPNAQNVTSVDVKTTLINEDKIQLDNYNYILYSSTGEVVKKGNLSGETTTITFTDLDPEVTYTIKVYADFDISDGNGLHKNEEIGNATFTTLALSKLGSLKLDINYDIDKDITSKSAKINIAVNTTKTDQRLIDILKSVTLIIKDNKNNEVKKIEMTDVKSLKADGISNFISNLKSNTTYKIDAKVDEQVEDMMTTKTKAPTESLKITKITTDNIYYTLNIDSQYVYDSGAKIAIYVNNEATAYDTINLSSSALEKAPAGGYTGSFKIPQEYKTTNGSIKLELQDTMYNGKQVDQYLGAKIINY